MKRIMKNIKEVKHQIINTSLVVASVVGTLAYLVSLYRNGEPSVTIFPLLLILLSLPL